MEINGLELKHGNVIELKSGRRLLYVEGFSFVRLSNEDNTSSFLETDVVKIYKDYTLEELLWEYKERLMLTEDEKVILRNLHQDFRYIARDKNDDLYIYIEKPHKGLSCWCGVDDCRGIHVFNHLFQFIKWENEEPYLISELLED